MLDAPETADVHCPSSLRIFSPSPSQWRGGRGVRFSMTTVSIWQDTSIWPALPHRREAADVCIIGAGIVGSTLAHFLGQAGKSVIVLEARDVALGASGRNAGHVSAHGKAGYHTA